MRRARFFYVIKYVAAFAVAGLLYAVFVERTGISIPCPFHLVTGLKCPGCGVTRMCLALLRLDFAEAFWSNPMLFLLTPLLAFIFAGYLIDYIKEGQWRMNRVQTMGLYTAIVLLCGFGILRNIFGL